MARLYLARPLAVRPAPREAGNFSPRLTESLTILCDMCGVFILQSASSFGYAECAALVVGERADHAFDASVVVAACKALAPGVDVVCVGCLEHEVEDAPRLARENGGAAVPYVVSVEEDVPFFCLYVDFGVVECLSEGVLSNFGSRAVVGEGRADAGHACPGVCWVVLCGERHDGGGASGVLDVVKVDDGGDAFGLCGRACEAVVAKVHVHALVGGGGFAPGFGLREKHVAKTVPCERQDVGVEGDVVEGGAGGEGFAAELRAVAVGWEEGAHGVFCVFPHVVEQVGDEHVPACAPVF